MIGLQMAARNVEADPAADFDAVIIGAGVSGLYQLYRLRQLGLRVRVFETGSGVGGTWYWNRYPGARFDSESWTYGYSFSQELLDEWDWEEHFAGQPETERYLNYVAAKIGQEEMRRIRANYPEIFERCQQTYGCFIHATDPRATHEVTGEEREAFWEKLYNEPGFGIWMGNFRDILVDREANKLISDFVACTIRERVRDTAIAEKLIPKNHGFGTRRVPLESGYFEVYNQSNVKLIDITETPIERITPTGIKTSAAEYEFDIIIYATGFDAITGAFDRIDIRGVDGVSLKEKWKDGPQTFLGILVDGFPNMLMVMGPHAGLGNFPRAAESSGEWGTALLRSEER